MPSSSACTSSPHLSHTTGTKAMLGGLLLPLDRGRREPPLQVLDGGGDRLLGRDLLDGGVLFWSPLARGEHEREVAHRGLLPAALALPDLLRHQEHVEGVLDLGPLPPVL